MKLHRTKSILLLFQFIFLSSPCFPMKKYKIFFNLEKKKDYIIPKLSPYFPTKRSKEKFEELPNNCLAEIIKYHKPQPILLNDVGKKKALHFFVCLRATLDSYKEIKRKHPSIVNLRLVNKKFKNVIENHPCFWSEEANTFLCYPTKEDDHIINIKLYNKECVKKFINSKTPIEKIFHNLDLKNKSLKILFYDGSSVKWDESLGAMFIINNTSKKKNPFFKKMKKFYFSKKIKNLSIYDYKGDFSKTNLEWPKNLEKLFVAHSKNFYTECLKNLTKLQILDFRYSRFNGKNFPKNLLEFIAQTKNVEDIASLEKCENLKKITLLHTQENNPTIQKTVDKLRKRKCEVNLLYSQNN